MTLSVFDIFKIGIGPSSSHTVGPMRAALTFVQMLEEKNLLQEVDTIRIELFGSLGATGKGHGTNKAVLLGLLGESPDTVNPDSIEASLDKIHQTGLLNLIKQQTIQFNESENIIFHRKALPFHSNGMFFTAINVNQETVLKKEFYSVGGGFVVSETTTSDDENNDNCLPYPFKSADDLLKLCLIHKCSISHIMFQNEKAWLSKEEIKTNLLHIWHVMQACVQRGLTQEGILPGGMKVKRRAASLYRQLKHEQPSLIPMGTLDWVNLYALAVSEENAAGGRVVTAPTNGAAGIIPSVLHYYCGVFQDSCRLKL